MKGNVRSDVLAGSKKFLFIVIRFLERMKKSGNIIVTLDVVKTIILQKLKCTSVTEELHDCENDLFLIGDKVMLIEEELEENEGFVTETYNKNCSTSKSLDLLT